MQPAFSNRSQKAEVLPGNALDKYLIVRNIMITQPYPRGREPVSHVVLENVIRNPTYDKLVTK